MYNCRSIRVSVWCVCVAGTRSDGSSDQRVEGPTSQLFPACFPEFPKFRLFLSAEPSIGRSMQYACSVHRNVQRWLTSKAALRIRTCVWPGLPMPPVAAGAHPSPLDFAVVTLGPSSLRSAVHRRRGQVWHSWGRPRSPAGLSASILGPPLSCRNSWLL